jgi:hypothetical protein
MTPSAWNMFIIACICGNVAWESGVVRNLDVRGMVVTHKVKFHITMRIAKWPKAANYLQD